MRRRAPTAKRSQLIHFRLPLRRRSREPAEIYRLRDPCAACSTRSAARRPNLSLL